MIDLVFWGVRDINGWPIEHLPVDVLVNVWQGLQNRYCKQVNDYNYGSALLISIKQAKEGERITPEKWLPYNIGEASSPKISVEITTKLLKLRNEGKLPLRMIQDLYKHQILSPTQK